MDNEFQKRWERIQRALAAELSGEAKPRVSSGRTLFGIKSEGETKMDFFRSVVNVAADFIAMHRCRLHVNGGIEPRLAHAFFHDEFSHR